MTANFLRLRCPNRSTSHAKSPYEVWSGNKSTLANLKVFGCYAYVHVTKPKWSKLDARSIHCRFIGYSDYEKAYRFEVIKSRRVQVSRDAQFMENVFDSERREYLQDEAIVEDDAFMEDEDVPIKGTLLMTLATRNLKRLQWIALMGPAVRGTNAHSRWRP